MGHGLCGVFNKGGVLHFGLLAIINECCEITFGSKGNADVFENIVGVLDGILLKLEGS